MWCISFFMFVSLIEIGFGTVDSINEDGGVTQVCVNIIDAGNSPVETTINIIATGSAGLSKHFF